MAVLAQNREFTIFLRSTYFKIAIRKSKFVEIIVNPTAVSTAINDDNSKSRLFSVIFSISDIFILSVIFGVRSVTTKNLNVISYLIN